MLLVITISWSVKVLKSEIPLLYTSVVGHSNRSLKMNLMLFLWRSSSAPVFFLALDPYAGLVDVIENCGTPLHSICYSKIFYHLHALAVPYRIDIAIHFWLSWHAATNKKQIMQSNWCFHFENWFYSRSSSCDKWKKRYKRPNVQKMT